MDLKGILAISGYPGLFKLVKQARNSIIVESLEDGKRMPAYATSKISALEDIAIYTSGEDVQLHQVFKNLYTLENGGVALTSKLNNEEVKSYFGKILPEYDKERVYVSDMKRVFSWYNILHKHNLVDLEDPKPSEETEAAEGSESDE